MTTLKASGHRFACSRLLTGLALSVSVALVSGAQAQAPAQAEKPAPAKSAQPAKPAQAKPAQPAADAKAAAPAAQQAPRPISGTTTGWVKVCQQIPDTTPPREGCMISQEVRAENGAFLSSMAVQEMSGEARKQLILAVPLGMAIQAGLLLRVDNNSAMPAKYGTCLANGCFAGVDMGTDLLNAMKKGQNAYVTVRNAQGVALDLVLPLATFAKAYDGAATDLKVVEEQQKKLQDELVRRAEKTREELLKQQGGSTSVPAAKP